MGSKKLQRARTGMAVMGLIGAMSLGVPLANAAAAADDMLGEFSLDEIVVTASRMPENIFQVPASVSVITDKDIKQKNIVTITDALKELPGVYVNRPSGLSEVANGIQIRGFDEADILVLYDGMPLNMGYDGGVNWNVIAIDDVARIELVRGAASSLYGGRAVGGVISITSKDPDRDKVRAYATYGSEDTWKSGLSLAKKLSDKWSASIGYEHRRTDGHYKKLIYKYASAAGKKSSGPVGTGGHADIRSDGRAIYVLGIPGTGASRDDNFNFKLKYKFDDEKSLTYRYTYDNYKYFSADPVSYVRDSSGNPLFTGSVRLPNGRWINFSEGDFTDYDGRRRTDEHALLYKDEGNKLHGNLGFVDTRDAGYSTGNSFNGNTPGNDTKYPSKSYKLDMQKTWELDNQTIVASLDFQRDSMDRTAARLSRWQDWDSITQITNRAGGKNLIQAIGIQDKYTFNDQFAIIAGLRYDHYRKYDGYTDNFVAGTFRRPNAETFTEWSPKLTFEYTPNKNTTLFLSYGHSFNPPKLYHLFRDDPASGYLANPDLKPESSDTIELGLKQQLDKKNYLGLSLYRSETKDLVSLRRFNIGGVSYRQYQNLTEATRSGIELDYRCKFDEALSSYINWSIQWGEDGNGNNLDEIPRHIFHAGLKYDKDKLAAYLDCEFVSRRQPADYATGKFFSDDPYFVANLGVSYRFIPTATVSFTVENLFDRDYWQWYKAGGRRYYVGMQFEV